MWKVLSQKLTLLIKPRLNSTQKFKEVGPLKVEKANQLDQLKSLRFKHTLEEVEQKYNNSLDHHISTTTTMLKIHDNMINATNELLKQTHMCHEKKIQWLEKEIKKKDELNLIMQQVLIKLL
ncbi:unnamed protein product [Lactuca saligna]|uniref:Uncharacterized protein n=1 Tax=Lactuca saligna TaxID=75948 RepID=A0AA36EK20_LACSI|nr:unnamed protein product [Lactuca saligna]